MCDNSSNQFHLNVLILNSETGAAELAHTLYVFLFSLRKYTNKKRSPRGLQNN
ncbi:hypothetical protein BCBMB205_20510 [Bacillus sp. CN2]|nr:hypothetical protein BCBMB205_20510 [Bacillus velezensis]ARZ58388.1 hypothetical protein BAGQ_2155 [Bacillus velezensis]GFR56767.1 hypothetical protein BCBMB205_20510 [Bacillus sp. CN2]